MFKHACFFKALLGLMLVVPMGCVRMGAMPANEDIPSPPREFRAAWVATVANIDWPSKPGLPVEKQMEEAVAILDKCQALNLNAVIFQVRPQADALYESKLEPWSYYLTGKMGQAPDPMYDPLAFWVSEAHARNLELHTWYNPYRANHPANKGGLSDDSIVKAHPELVVKLGDKGYYWMDPSLKGVQDHSIAVVMDVVRRYDIDGVHFDDYFYPYPSYNDGADFPDQKSWEAYQASGGKLTRNDWRRKSVDDFIERLYKEIKAEKPHVKFGISPFGIWRPGHPPSIQGLDQYDVLFADAKLWFNKGWVDYFTPQLYWDIAKIPQSYPVLMEWWSEQNLMNRHLWPGTSIGRARSEGGTTEILNQIQINRAIEPQSPGIVYFSMKTLQNNNVSLGQKLVEGPYKEKALVPASPWLDKKAPRAPIIRLDTGEAGRKISWESGGDQDIFQWVVYTQSDGNWTHEILPGSHASMPLVDGEKPITQVAVSAVDRCGNESPKSKIILKK